MSFSYESGTAQSGWFHRSTCGLSSQAGLVKLGVSQEQRFDRRVSAFLRIT